MKVSNELRKAIEAVWKQRQTGARDRRDDEREAAAALYARSTPEVADAVESVLHFRDELERAESKLESYGIGVRRESQLSDAQFYIEDLERFSALSGYVESEGWTVNSVLAELALARDKTTFDSVLFHIGIRWE